MWLTCRHCGSQTKHTDLPNQDLVFCNECGLLLAEPGMIRPLPYHWLSLKDRPHLGSWWDAECAAGHKLWLALPLMTHDNHEWKCSCGAPLLWGTGRPLKPGHGP